MPRDECSQNLLIPFITNVPIPQILLCFIFIFSAIEVLKNDVRNWLISRVDHFVIGY